MIKVIGISNSCYEEVSIDECLEYLNNLEEICCDTETTGLFNFSNRILLLQLGDKYNQYVINASIIDIIVFKSVLESKLILLQNAKFDWKFLYQKGIDIKHIYDTFLAECVLTTGYSDEERDLSLKGLTLKYCNKDIDKSIRGVIHKESTSDRVITYAATDLIYLQEIRDKQIEQIIYWDLESVLELENKVVRVYAMMEYHGIKLDSTKWGKVADITEANTKECIKILDNLIVEEAKINKKLNPFINNQCNLFAFEESKTLINWISPKQKQVILGILGIKLDSVGIPELIKISTKHKIIPTLIELSKQQKLASSFGRTFLKFINPITNRIHAEIWQILDSGRISFSNPNLLQIPAHGDLATTIKNSFVAEDNYVIIDSDYAGFELRVLAELSQDPLWLGTYNNGGDLHSILCSRIFAIPLEDVENPFPYRPEVSYRFVQKTINFGLNNNFQYFNIF